MRDIRKAIRARLTADTRLMALITGVYVDSAPQKAVLPYIVMYQVSKGGVQQLTGASDTRWVNFDFDIVGTNGDVLHHAAILLSGEGATPGILNGWSDVYLVPSISSCTWEGEETAVDDPIDSSQAGLRHVMPEYKFWFN